MTIEERLLKDKLHNKEEAVAIAKMASSSPEKFKQLMNCFTSPEYRLAQRAALSVSYSVNINPQLIFPYIKTLVEQLVRTDVHDAVIRNSIRILKEIDIPEQYHGYLMNACFLLAEKPETPIAIKAFSLSTLYKLFLLYPDIKAELEVVTEAALETESAAVKSVSKKILKDLNKSKSPRINH